MAKASDAKTASAVLLLAFGCLCSAAVEDEAVITKYQDICAQEGGGTSTVILSRDRLHFTSAWTEINFEMDEMSLVSWGNLSTLLPTCFQSCCVIYKEMPVKHFQALAKAFSPTLENSAVWIVEGSSWENEETLADLPIGLDSRIFLVQEGGAAMKEAYKVFPSDPGLSRRPFDPTKDLGIDLHTRRMNLMGREVGISVAEYTYWQIKDYKNGTVTGAGGEILDIMRSMLNFTMRYVPIDTSSGPLSEPGAAGKYFGMGIGFLHLADDVDILIDAHSVSLERQQFVDFSLTLNQDLGYFVIGRRARRTFLTFFDEISLTCALAIFLYTFVLAFPPFKASKETTSKVTTVRDFAQRYMNWLISVYLSLGCLWTVCEHCEKKKSRHQQRWSQRIKMLSILTFGYVVYVYYASNMSAFLTIQSDYYPFDSMQGLMDSEYLVAVEKNTITQFFFSEAPQGTILRTIWEKKMKNHPENLITNNGEDSLSSRTKKSVATVVIQDQIERYPGYPCKIWYMRRPKFSYRMAFPVKKNSPLLPLFNKVILHLKQTGKLQKIISKNQDLVFGSPQTELNCAPDAEAVSLEGVQFPLVTVAVGGAAALLLAAAERLAALRRPAATKRSPHMQERSLPPPKRTMATVAR